jgi:hypothetical protein
MIKHTGQASLRRVSSHLLLIAGLAPAIPIALAALDLAALGQAADAGGVDESYKTRSPGQARR